MDNVDTHSNSHYVLEACEKQGRVTYGVFWTKAQAEEALGCFVEDSSISADYWHIVQWRGAEVVYKFCYERIVTFRCTSVEWE